MAKEEKYNQVFINCFKVDAAELSSLAYGSVPAWNSVGQMVLVEELEKAFDIEVEMEDILDIRSYAQGKVVLKKYGVKI